MPWADWRFDAIGVPWRIDTPEALPVHVRSAASTRVDDFDAAYSRFRADSLVSRIARAPGRWVFPDDAAPLFALYRSLYALTAGRFSPLVGARLASLGYDAAYSLAPAPQQAAIPPWDETVSWNFPALTTTIPTLIDFGAAGKGYLVDIVAELLDDAGCTEYLIDASGDLLHRGDEPVRIGLEDPTDSTKAIGIVTLRNAALCASAPNRRTWGSGIHHILDAVTGLPTQTAIATWAIASNALTADGLATALFLAEPSELAARFDFEYVTLFPAGRAVASAGFPGELFT